jgi:hypothetical protein
MKKVHIGVIIGVILIVYWYLHDHPQILHPAPAPTQQGSLQALPSAV